MMLPGCALYTPVQVFRFTADYNTERRPSMQAEVFEHLPPFPARVRLNKWAYNVGPMPSTSSIPIPSNAPIAPTQPAPASPLPPVPPLPSPELNPPRSTIDSDLLDEAQPPEFAPTSPGPRTDLRSEERGNRMGPSARANGSVRGASYEVPVRQSQVAPEPAGAWLFAR